MWMKIYSDDNTQILYAFYDGMSYKFVSGTWEPITNAPPVANMRLLPGHTFYELYRNLREVLGCG